MRIAYCGMSGIATLWYMVAAAVIVGIMVAYAAMFGYDKLKEALSSIITLSESSLSTEASDAETPSTKNGT